MTTEQIIQLILSFLGGGVVVAVLDWVRTTQSERKARRIEHVRSQLQSLYGPLQFFTSQNARLFELNDNFQKAYTKEYVEKKWSQAESTQKRVSQWASETLQIANQYIELVLKNNVSILGILENHYALIEPADVEIFSRFVVDHTRMKIEIGEAGQLKTPFEIYEHLGEISFMRPEFIGAVEKRFKEKQIELGKLLK